MKEGERVQQYAIRVKKLVSIGWADESKDVQNSKIRDYFVEGLPSKIQSYINKKNYRRQR